MSAVSSSASLALFTYHAAQNPVQIIARDERGISVPLGGTSTDEPCLLLSLVVETSLRFQPLSVATLLALRIGVGLMHGGMSCAAHGCTGTGV